MSAVVESRPASVGSAHDVHPCLTLSVLLEGLESMGIPISPSNHARANLILSAPSQIEGDVMPPALADAVMQLWQDPGCQQAYKRRNEMQINDSAP